MGGGGYVDCLDVDVVVDVVVIGIFNLIMMSACGVTNKVCECILVTHKKMQSSH